MTVKEFIIKQTDLLPESSLEKIAEFILYQRFSLGLYGDDTDYLMSIPGMVESIKTAASEPISECKDVSEVWSDV
jgi:hypothetical protein